MALDLLITKEAVCVDKHPGDPGAKVVACTSDKAAFQLAAKGTPISQEDADRLGIDTEKAELGNYTLRLDSHTIARTPEEKAWAATQPQWGLVQARTDQIRSAAALTVASLAMAELAKAAPDGEQKKADDEATAKAKEAAESKKAPKPAKAEKATTTKAKTPRKARTKKATKSAEAEKTPATP